MLLTLGGIGMFLLGMVLMTDGIKSAGGTALREILKRYIRGPISGMLAGAGLTATLQSSSATMLTTIGFVSAGLVTFPQAIGVIFGANLGTTSTGWIVALLGFKFSIASAALPMVLLGVLMRLLLRGRIASLGLAVAGFGVLFLGIGMMQEGMGGLATRIDLSELGRGGLLGVLLLVGVGVVMTVMMQSSSAAMAITLAALHTQSIDITQGAALVIGQNVGTTVTAALATIGASNAAKRTAAAHILFNLLTGVIALLLLPLFGWGVEWWESSRGTLAGVSMLAGFHTGFNVVGVALFLPVSGRYSRLIERLVPEHQSVFTRHLDPSVADLGRVGIEVAQRTLLDVLGAQCARGLVVLGARPGSAETLQRANEAGEALPEVTRFIARIGMGSSEGEVAADQIGLVHAVDHLDELNSVQDRLASQWIPGAYRERVEPIRAKVEAMLTLVEDSLEPGAWNGDVDAVARMSEEITDLRRSLRAEMLDSVARGRLATERGSDLIDRVRWLDSAAFHVWRAVEHLVDLQAKTQVRD